MEEINTERVFFIAEEFYNEFRQASEKFPAFASEHEGYAILLEEFDELWEAVKLNGKKNPDRLKRCRAEAIQIGAMALRFIYDMDNRHRMENRSIKHAPRETGSAICSNCGKQLLAPADGKPFWCLECSTEWSKNNRRV